MKTKFKVSFSMLALVIITACSQAQEASNKVLHGKSAKKLASTENNVNSNPQSSTANASD